MRTVSECRSCRARRMRQFLDLGDMPLTDAYVLPDESRPEATFPLRVGFCETCSLVQILYEIPPEEMFDDYQYYSSFSDTLLAHSRAHARRLINSHHLGPRSLVIELASNDGYMLRNFLEAGIPVLGIDPAPGPADAAEEAGVPTVREYFGPSLAGGLRKQGRLADVVIANNVLAHVPDLNGFVRGIATVLKESGVGVVEVPYVRDLIEHHEFDTIYHEHLCYFSVHTLERLFLRNGLFLNRVEHMPIHGGSLRVSVGLSPRRDESVLRYLREEEALGMESYSHYAGFGSAVEDIQTGLRSLLESLRSSGRTIAAYGAAAKGTVLLNSSGIGSDLIDFVVDRNVHKQGLLMPGVRIPIEAPVRLAEDPPDYLLILAWNFKDEIMRQESEYSRRGGKFILPIPSPTIVENNTTLDHPASA